MRGDVASREFIEQLRDIEMVRNDTRFGFRQRVFRSGLP